MSKNNNSLVNKMMENSKSNLLLSKLAHLQGKNPNEVWPKLYGEMCDRCFRLYLDKSVSSVMPWPDFCKQASRHNGIRKFYYIGPDLYSEEDEVLALLFSIADNAAKFRGREPVSCFPLWGEYRCMIDVPSDIGASGPTRHAAIRTALEKLGAVE